MNKKGNVFASVMIVIILFMIGMIVVNFYKPLVDTARTDLTCSAPATDGTKVMCLLVDFVIPYFIVLVFSIAGGIIADRILP